MTNGKDPDKIWVTISRTINMGNYESYKLELGESRTVLPDETPSKLRMEISKQITKEIDFVERKLTK